MTILDKEELAPGIVIYRNVLEDAEQFLIDFEDAMQSGLQDLAWKEPYILKNGESVVDHEIRRLDTYGIPYIGKIVREDEALNPSEMFKIAVSNRIFLATDFIEKDYLAGYGATTTTHDMYNVLKYGKDHFFINHIDDNPSFNRTVSSILYLNDNYTGGEIEFPRFNLRIKPEANSMLLFPSTYVYNHEVHRITSGTRYAIVSWMD